MSAPRLAAAGVATGAVLALGLLWHTPDEPRPPAAPAAAPLVARAAAPAEPARPAWRATLAVPPEFERWVLERSALRGTTPDGGWGPVVDGRLVPSAALRRRFDYALQLDGQAPAETIGAWVGEQARRELPATAAAEVERLWQAYQGLRAAPASLAPRADDPESIAAALDERHAQRVQWLGEAWARAFYGDEEAALRARLVSGWQTASADALIDATRLDSAARQRLADELAEQARWAERIAAARAELERLDRQPGLDEVQRAQVAEQLLAAGFAEGSERLRARGLLGR
ncbi:lipase secretion chaperone [Rubrivivax sp. JA1055]|uniref:lipase secretion chaperone n=1 Tax=Rubrivivax sp. JA1055 TaxID=2894194 RepID=UPI001E3001F7|nr:lipase secretion chaperone [Rubrivivax sp. JA1055]MCC9596748.1 lipase chaperone [Rubrivivax sp. JA1055]